MKRVFIAENVSLAILDSLLISAIIGIVVGARLGHCLFYDPDYYLANPLKILAIWEGGLASHGGGVGVLVAVLYHAKRYQLDKLWLLDRLAISTAIFAVFVRLANFVNSEILGTPTSLPWAIVFQRVDYIPRHPVQLYEAICYLVIFALLWTLYRRGHAAKSPGALLGIFLFLTFSARFVIEFAKQKQAAFTTESMLSMGQLLSIPFLLIGLAIYCWTSLYRKNKCKELDKLL